ncbi:unnamed protein product, partial [Discosporangium mesarthrocarpum]
MTSTSEQVGLVLSDSLNQLRQLQAKIAKVETAMESGGSYLGIMRGQRVLLAELTSLRQQELQLREVQMMALRQAANPTAGDGQQSVQAPSSQQLSNQDSQSQPEQQQQQQEQEQEQERQKQLQLQHQHQHQHQSAQPAAQPLTSSSLPLSQPTPASAPLLPIPVGLPVFISPHLQQSPRAATGQQEPLLPSLQGKDTQPGNGNAP